MFDTLIFPIQYVIAYQGVKVKPDLTGTKLTSKHLLKASVNNLDIIVIYTAHIDEEVDEYPSKPCDNPMESPIQKSELANMTYSAHEHSLTDVEIRSWRIICLMPNKRQPTLSDLI